ncbi:MAG: hypothetical protein H6707_12495 [Deltaproteobacteria bacterium]|nr:hypothetical protein [Deltaproteobacteria bacterium]
MSTIQLDDLLKMPSGQLGEVLAAGHALDADQLAGQQYLGVDLSLPKPLSWLLWKTFCKTFYRDPLDAELRGWNVKTEQRGVDGPIRPLRWRSGAPVTFGHYVVRSKTADRFPLGLDSPSALDYGTRRNRWYDPSRALFTPLVAVNAASMDLLLGQEVVRVGRRAIALPLYFALRHDGAIAETVPVGAGSR